MPKTTFSYAPAYYGNPSSGAAALPAQKAAMTAIHNGLLAIGLTQLSDTGQLDIDAMPAMTTTGTAENVAGFRLYEMVDELTPTLRVIIKVEFCRPPIGHSNAQFAEVMLNISVGHGTDGAGNFVGGSVVVSKQVLSTTSSAPGCAPSVQSFMCVKDHTILLAVGLSIAVVNTLPSTPIIAGFAVIGRTRDADGLADGRGVVGFGAADDGYITQLDRRMVMSLSVPSAGIAVKNIKDSPGLMGAYLAMASVSGAPQVQFPMAAVPRMYPFTQLGMVPVGGALSAGDIIELNVDGAVRQYVALSPFNIWPSVTGPTVSINGRSASDMFFGCGFSMLYET